MSSLICPVCHSEVKLPEHSSFGYGMTLAKDTDNCTYKLNMEKTTEYGTENRVEKERTNMGIDLTKAVTINENKNYFTFTSPEGKEVKMKWENGIPVVVANEPIDEIEEQIYVNGYVKNTKVHRRWVMAQMFRGLNYKNTWDHTSGFEAWLQNHGYYYQWKMALEELRVMSKIEGNDAEAFAERSTFFTKEVIVRMIKDYSYKLGDRIAELPVHKCKGVPYKTMPDKRDVFVADISKKIYKPIVESIDRINRCHNYRDLYWVLKAFLRNAYIELPYNTKMSRVFVDVYKREGAYYTLKNMIMFHNIYLQNYYTGARYDTRDSLTYLTEMNDKYRNDGYKLLALLKKTIEDNNFDFDARMKEIYNS